MIFSSVPLFWRFGRLLSQIIETLQVPLPENARPSRSEMFRLRRLVDNMRERSGDMTIAVSGYPHPFRVRNGTSDLEVVLQLFVQHELGFDLDFSPKWIIDLGANIGLGSIYLANRFPQARIVAVEVEKANFHLLAENCAPYPNIIPVEKAVWSLSGYVRISNPDAKPWSFRVEATSADDPLAIEAISINQLMADFRIDEIGLLKMDIEGAERHVLSESLLPWLDRTRMLAVELHERYVPGCTAALELALAGRSFLRTQRGEYVIAKLQNEATS